MGCVCGVGGWDVVSLVGVGCGVCVWVGGGCGVVGGCWLWCVCVWGGDVVSLVGVGCGVGCGEVGNRANDAAAPHQRTPPLAPLPHNSARDQTPQPQAT